MKENDIKNAGKALTITTVLTLFIATFEMVNALRFYKPGMNLLDIASYVQANRWIFAFTFIFANLVLFPSALLLYKANGISLKKEIYERETLGGDILWGVILAIAASLLSLLSLPIYKGRTELAFVEDEKMGVGITILYVIALVFVSGICKEIYFRGFQENFVGRYLERLRHFYYSICSLGYLTGIILDIPSCLDLYVSLGIRKENT